MKFGTKLIQQCPSHLRHIATLPGEIKSSNFLQILGKKMQTNCIYATILIPLRICVCWVYLRVNRIFEILSILSIFSFHCAVCRCLAACQLCLCPATFSTAYEHHALSSFSQEICLSTSLLCTLSNTNFSSKSCPRHWIPCWLLTNIAVMSAVTNFRCHKLIARVNE